MSDDADVAHAADGAEPPAKEGDQKGPTAGSEAPDGQEKFDSVMQSPYGGDARAAGDAYRRGRQSFRVKGPGAVVTDSRIDNVVVGNFGNLFATRTVQLTPGPVRTEDLERIRARYVPVTEYDTALDLLQDRHLILLRGSAGTGRTTTTLHLLDAVTGGQISRLDPEVEVYALRADDLKDGCGYLVELPTSRAAALTQMHLDRLSALLAEKSCWCVLIVGRDFPLAQAVAGYVTNYGPPSFEQLFRGHLTWKMPEADAGVREKLCRLADSTGIREAMGPAPTPAEVSGLVQLLVESSQQSRAAEAVAARCAVFVDHLVAEWFDDVRDPPRGESGDRSLRFIGYRIALAVLNHTSQHFVAEAGERLGARLILTRAPRREPGRPVFGSEHRYWLEASRGHVIPGVALVGDTTVPVELAAFADDRIPVAVLKHVWRHHHNTRSPLLSWLADLADDVHPEVWVRAAQAAGLLCALDFPDVFRSLIRGWAGHTDTHRRLVAAFALDQAAQERAVLPAVREVINSWKNDGDEAQRWTVAAALGYDLGLASVEDALNDLRALGTWREDEETPVARIASESVARLLAQGEVEKVAHRLLSWLEDRRTSVCDLALLTIIRLSRMKVNDLWDINIFASGSGRDRWPLIADRGRWPLLLALQDEDAKFTEPFADLVWRSLDTARSRDAALKSLTRWIQGSERDRSYLPALASFLRLLADTPSSARRLRQLVADLRAGTQRPLAPAVANYLDQALDESRNKVSTP